jgi:hypothetical protein
LNLFLHFTEAARLDVKLDIAINFLCDISFKLEITEFRILRDTFATETVYHFVFSVLNKSIRIGVIHWDLLNGCRDIERIHAVI